MPHEKIQELYDQIPQFDCNKSCHDCCGVVPWAKSEWDLIENKRGQKGMDCPYINPLGGCDCYDNRPFLCRLFGTVKTPLMRCPHGYKPNKMISKLQGRMLAKRYHDLMEEILPR